MDPDGRRRQDPDASSFPELLDFASRAQTLISELLLLSDRLPRELRDPCFDPVLFDLRYLDSPSDYESRVEGNAELEDLEEQLRGSCSDFFQRFFLLANGIVAYHLDLKKHLNDLQEGMVQCSLDKVLDDECGRQLLTESMALFGCLLLLMEHRMSGNLRERLLVAYVRHVHHSDILNIEQISLLCRAHSTSPSSLRHAILPPLPSALITIPKMEDFFARFPFPRVVVDAVICRLRDDDLYNQLRHYPDPLHRTVALSSQAGCLFVLLFYSPEFLHDGLFMREIVDRFFKDSWVIPVCMHFAVDLFVAWDAYKDAKASLSSCLSPAFVRDRTQLHSSKVADFLSEIGSVLLKGNLMSDYMLDNSQSLLSLIRNYNVSLRWFLLHRISNEKKLRDVVTSTGMLHQIGEESLLQLFLKTSQLEFEVKQRYKDLLEGREALWHEKKQHASDCLKELSRFYSGSWASSCKIKNESVKDWLMMLSSEVHSLECTRISISGRAIYRVISALKDLEQFNQIEESSEMKPQISEVKRHLQDMVKILNLDSDTMACLSVITDAVYAWAYIARFSELLTKKLEQDISIILNLHTFFLKFQTLLNAPLLRIVQNQSPDLPFVSNYYSSVYTSQIRTTLKSTPLLLFRISDKNDVKTWLQFSLLNRIEKDTLQDFMQLDRQFNSAERANKISIFSQGMLMLSRNLCGLINQDIQHWFEAQIRKELSRQLESKLKSIFLSSHNDGPDRLKVSLRTLSAFVLSQLHMIQSFQDLLHLNGDHIWQEVFTATLKQCAKLEYDGLLTRRQDSVISTRLNVFSKPQTFYGHLLLEVLRLTDPSRSMYIEPMSGWFDAEGRELLGLHFFDLLESCIGQVGLASFDYLIATLIKEYLEYALRSLKDLLDTRFLEEVHKLDNCLGPATSLPVLGYSSYKQMVNIINTSWEPWIECIAYIGQLQLLRCLISLKLKSACKVKAGPISSAIQGLILSIFSHRKKILECMELKGEESAPMQQFFHTLDEQRKVCGFFYPLQTLYMSKDPPSFLSRCASICTILQLSRYVLDTHLGTLTSRLKKSIIDFTPAVIGLGTFLKQFPPIYVTQYVQFMGQHTRMAETESESLYEPRKGSIDPSAEVRKSAFWLMNFCKYMGVSKDLADSCLPPSFIAMIQA